MKKVYFAGSIRGGRVDAKLYERLIKYIQRTDIVLTEHIGCSNLNLMEQGKKDEDIYTQDMTWLRESDVLIAECTCPSLGVGYELAYAEKCGKECHIFFPVHKFVDGFFQVFRQCLHLFLSAGFLCISCIVLHIDSSLDVFF